MPVIRFSSILNSFDTFSDFLCKSNLLLFSNMKNKTMIITMKMDIERLSLANITMLKQPCFYQKVWTERKKLLWSFEFRYFGRTI